MYSHSEICLQVDIVCGGSYRRGKASCGDLDIIITHPDGNRYAIYLLFAIWSTGQIHWDIFLIACSCFGYPCFLSSLYQILLFDTTIVVLFSIYLSTSNSLGSFVRSHKGFLPNYVKHLKDMKFLREDLVFSLHSEEVIWCPGCFIILFSRIMQFACVSVIFGVSWIEFRFSPIAWGELMLRSIWLCRVRFDAESSHTMLFKHQIS